jgi:hypothetical protein
MRGLRYFWKRLWSLGCRLETFAALSKEPLSFEIKEKWFRSRTPLDEEKTPSADQLKPIETLLYDLYIPISQVPSKEFPRSQRIRLAFKIVECGLMLSGTTRLSKIDSCHLATGSVSRSEGPQTPLRQHINRLDRQLRGVTATVGQTLRLLLLPAFHL